MLLIITAVILGGCARAPFYASNHIAATHQSETDFLATAAAIVKKEISIAETTLQSGTNEELKDLARSVVDNQTFLLQELDRISAARGINLYQRSVRDEKPRITNAGVEKTFIAALTEDRKELIRAFEFQFRDGQSSDIRNLAGNTLPLLRQHMHVASQLWSAMQTAAISSEPAGGQTTGPLRNSPNP